ncbi:MAG: long-chain fatty acid--CoA ligase [Candidatus Korobacteraceae bacterium]
MTPDTLNDVFFTVAERGSSRVALTRQPGAWQPITAEQMQARVYATARHMRDWGIRKGDRVAILSENRPEWAIADFASLLLGAVDVPIYATQTPEQCLHILQHSHARVLFVSTRKQYEKIAAITPLTQLERVVIMDDGSGLHDVIPMAEMLYDAKPGPDPELESIARSIRPDDVATLIYTSGTTGTPKGVILTHGNVASNLSMTRHLVNVGPDDVCISFLPLSHITARHLDYLLFYRGVTIAYCPVIDELPEVMLETKPTLFVGVPRVYEKLCNQVQLKAKGVKRKILHWCLEVGRKHRDTVLAGGRPKAMDWKLADRLVFSKLIEKMGGRVRLFLSGGAPLGIDLASWFADIGIVIHEGYGLTETSPVIAINVPGSHKIGTVGRPLKNLELRLASDGELLVRGPSIFKGYWEMPEETTAAFEDGGWFKTGDIAAIDDDGFLSIVDRKKDLIKTSGGKFIAPQPIESALKVNMFVGEVALLGDRRRFPAVLIVPNFTVLEDWARGHGLHTISREELVRAEKVRTLYQEIVDELNANLAQYEKLKKILLVPNELSIADGTLTPSMKLRRRKVEELYRVEIDTLYAESEMAPAGRR